MSTTRSFGRRGAAAPTAGFILVLVALLAVFAVSRAGALDGAETAAGGFGTLGTTTAGTGWQKMTDDAKRGSRYLYDGPAGSELYKVSARLRGEPSSDGFQTVDAVVYADNGGAPGALLGQSTQNVKVFGKQSAGTVDFPLAQPVPLQPGMRYWLMLHSGLDGAIAEYAYDVVPDALSFETQQADLKTDGPEDPAGPMGKDDRQPTIWASYRPVPIRPSPASDRDSDGVADADDHCPDAFGSASRVGCPASATPATPTSPTSPDPPTPGRPRAVTSAPLVVTSDSAQLTGIVVPAGDTSWFFEWGRTARFGQRTTPQVLPAGTGAAPVDFPLEKLRPDTHYRYRLVAEGPGGRGEGKTLRFDSQPLPHIVINLPVALGCDRGADRCRINSSSLDITLVESDGQLARTARLAGLHVRIVLRGKDRVLGRSSFNAGSRVHPPTLRGPGRVTLRRRIVDGTPHFALGRLMRGQMAVGTRLEVFVTRKDTIGGYYRLKLRPKGKELPDTLRRRCAIKEGTTRTLRNCHTL